MDYTNLYLKVLYPFQEAKKIVQKRLEKTPAKETNGVSVEPKPVPKPTKKPKKRSLKASHILGGSFVLYGVYLMIRKHFEENPVK